ncbi:hypothetical protein MN608_04004 [Microdochium nivale]|nr:hypothetical protein MN608_04004 [Microdochium nivale]
MRIVAYSLLVFQLKLWHQRLLLNANQHHLLGVGDPFAKGAKHVSPSVKSAVLYEGIANTISDNEEASDAQRAAALLGCAAHGEQMGVVVNKQNPAYPLTDFKNSKVKGDDIVIKLAKVPA